MRTLHISCTHITNILTAIRHKVHTHTFVLSIFLYCPSQVSMIEDELVARRGFWRRQRQREEEMVMVESHLTHQLILEIENLAPNKVCSI